MGYGLIWVQNQEVKLLEMSCLRISSQKSAFERLRMIQRKISDLIDLHKPNDFAIEAPFFGKNVQSMLKLGRAQGVAIATAMQAGIPVTEYSPKKVKQSITGNGNAAKEQVWKMLQQILKIQQTIPNYDASDALAVALCHHYQQNNPVNTGKKMKGWEEFISKNPGRLKGR